MKKERKKKDDGKERNEGEKKLKNEEREKKRFAKSCLKPGACNSAAERGRKKQKIS